MMYPFPCVPLILPIFALCSLHTGSLATKQMQADPVGTESHRCSEPWELLSLHLCAEVAQHKHHSDNVAHQRCVVVSSPPVTLPPIYYSAICHFQFSLERIRNKTHKFKKKIGKRQSTQMCKIVFCRKLQPLLSACSH
jgi:hypothetical protein